MPVSVNQVETAPVSLLSGDDYAPGMLTLIEGATESIDLATFSITPRWPARGSRQYDVFSAIERAPARGLRCTAVLATHKPGSGTARFNLAAAAKMADAGWRVRWAPRAHLLHAKFLQADRRRAIIGSHNISHSAITSNIDLSVLIEFGSTPNQAARWWDSLLSRSTATSANPWRE